VVWGLLQHLLSLLEEWYWFNTGVQKIFLTIQNNLMMADFLPNPFQVQDAPFRRRSAIPLFLIHDGGGTIFNYCMLESLERDVHAISNPRFEQGGRWEGGIGEMAEEYVRLIMKTCPRNRILLGGEH